MAAPRAFLPWRKVRYWECLACGDCCKWFRVPLRMDEYANLLKNYGSSCIDIGVDRVYLARRPDGRCVFQIPMSGRWICGIQAVKPIACKQWPFIIVNKPLFGHDDLALLKEFDLKFYIYVDPKCRGLLLGAPSTILLERILPEVLKLSHGDVNQYYSTSRLLSVASRSRLHVFHQIGNRNLSGTHFYGGGLTPKTISNSIGLPSRRILKRIFSPGLQLYSK
ncbi:MAG: YkgJ family cysteine cluster protein [Candidatus Bathyarchaeia archaeon]